ncbi:MAG: aspartyl protease family protein [Planctomycetota bacterium]|jgi:predicted aspartyl protease
MHWRRAAVAIGAALALGLAGLRAPEDAANLFVLRRNADGLTVEVVPIAPDETTVLRCTGQGEGIIDLVFPPGPGQSAGIVTPGDGHTLVVRHAGDAIHVEARAADGSTRALPPRPLDDLARHDIRVSVTGGGERAAFLIEGHRAVRRDVGPVANMFAGRVPAAMLEQAYVVQTETFRRDAGPAVAGAVPLEVARWPFVAVTLPDGTRSDFIVDLGAATTTIDRGLLPAGTEIRPASMVEHSAAGTRTLKYAPGGATGSVQTVAGHATLDALRLGDLVVPGVIVTVLERMPDLFGRPVGGILGMDVMRRTDRLVLTLGGADPVLRFEADDGDGGGAAAVELPFAFVSTHLVVEAGVNGTPVFLILDTGAPTSFLDEDAAAAAGVEADERRRAEGHGLDEGTIEHAPAIIAELAVGGRLFESVDCRVAALAPFASLRGDGQHVGLMGTDFLARFDRVEIDFARRVVRLVE